MVSVGLCTAEKIHYNQIFLWGQLVEQVTQLYQPVMAFDSVLLAKCVWATARAALCVFVPPWRLSGTSYVEQRRCRPMLAAVATTTAMFSAVVTGWR